MKILVLKFRNIGDVLLITPLLSNLKQQYPESKIDVAVNKGTESMVSLNPNINKLFIYDRELIKSLSFIGKLWKEVQFSFSFRKEHYDIVINLTEGDRGAQIAWLSGASIRIGYQNKNWIFRNAFNHYLPKQEYRHTLETNLDSLRLLNLPIKSKRVEVCCSEEDTIFVEKKISTINYQLSTAGFIHIHPVSRWLFKCIADQTMAKIIDYCEIELKTKVVITAAPVQEELDKVNNILDFCKSTPVNLSGELTLKQTAALNKKAKLFIGVDTAVMHMSAANDTPVLAFFGPSGANHWGPWDNGMMQSSYTRKNGFQVMGKHRVFSESRECQPCGKDGCNGTKISDCLMNLDIVIIKKNIREMIHEAKS